jgi:C-22 sterol desaturase
MAVNASLASPSADAKFPIGLADSNGFLSTIANGANAWTVALTLFLVLVAYDQCECLMVARLGV